MINSRFGKEGSASSPSSLKVASGKAKRLCDLTQRRRNIFQAYRFLDKVNTLDLVLRSENSFGQIGGFAINQPVNLIAYPFTTNVFKV